MTDIREAHTQVEAVKIAMQQDKNGHVLKLSIHPSDTPESIMRDPVGTRYMVVLVRMDDEGNVVASQTDEEGRKAIKLAGTLCADENFQQWLIKVGEISDMTEVAASTWLRGYLRVTSRRELKTDAEARKRLQVVRDEFIAALNAGRHLR